MSDYKILVNANKILEDFRTRLSSIRTGRVNSSVLNNVLVEAYGTKMHINELATVTSPESNQLWITPFDKSLIKAIAQAITESNLGVNPMDDGAGLRLTFPVLTEEARKQRAKEAGKMLEEGRIIARNYRTDLLKDEKRKKENSEITEDDLSRFETDLQKEVDKVNQELEAIVKVKQDELMKM